MQRSILVAISILAFSSAGLCTSASSQAASGKELVPENWVPTIVSSHPAAQTVEEVLGPMKAMKLDDATSLVVYNPQHLPLNEKTLAELKTLLQKYDENYSSAGFNSGPSTHLYSLYAEFFPSGTGSAIQSSVLGPPMSRKNWTASKEIATTNIKFPPDWIDPRGGNASYVFYLTDGRQHYALQRDLFMMSESGSNAAELMVSPTLEDLQRMLTARYGMHNISSQAVFQMPADLLERKYTEAQWIEKRTATLAAAHEFKHSSCPAAFSKLGKP